MVTIRPNSRRTFTVKPVDSQGRSARIDGAPQWSVSPAGGVALAPSVDGLSCLVSYVSALDGQVLTVTGDADLSAGVRKITGTADLQTLPAEAVVFELSVGEEEPLLAAAPKVSAKK